MNIDIALILKEFESNNYIMANKMSNDAIIKLESLLYKLKEINHKSKIQLNSTDEEFIYQNDNNLLCYEKEIELTNVVEIKNTGYKLYGFPTTKLDYINEFLYSYQGHLYCKLYKNTYIKINLPSIVSISSDNKQKTMPCRWNTLEECAKNKLKKIPCSYLHEGDHITKICSNNRCIKNPMIGNPKTLIDDLKQLNFKDIKLILSYGFSDMIIALIWFSMNDVGTKNIIDISVW